MSEIIEAINTLKTERDKCSARIAEINEQLAQIAGVLPRRKRIKGEPVKVKTARKAKGTGKSDANPSVEG